MQWLLDDVHRFLWPGKTREIRELKRENAQLKHDLTASEGKFNLLTSCLRKGIL